MKSWMEAGIPDINKLESLEWVQAMMDCPQDAVWHAEGDVWTHTKMVLQALLNMPEYPDLSPEEQFVLLWAAIFHDIGKPVTTEETEEGRIISPRHAKVGEKMARQILWDLDIHLREQICAIVRLHGKPIWWTSHQQPHRHAVLNAERVSNRLLYLFAKADMLGRISKDENDFLDRIELYKDLSIEAKCWESSYVFHNEHSKFRFFMKGLDYPAELYDDTKFKIVVLSGIAGSGKDKMAESFDLPMIGLDEIRRELKISHNDKKGQGHVAQLAYKRAKGFAGKKQSFVWNSTNLTSDIRMRLLRTLSVYNPRFEMYYTETSIKKVMEHRSHQIPAKRLKAMYRILEMPLSFEGHLVEWRVWGK